MPSSSSSSSSSVGGESARRRRAKYERKFLRAAARGSLRGCKKAFKRASRRSGGAGLDVQAVDPDGRTALHLACVSGDDDLARWLIKRGADVTSTDARGDTPAHLAAHRAPDNVAVTRRLTGAGASAHARNDAGETPASIAERAAEARAARMREFDARRDARTRRGRDADEYEGLGAGPSVQELDEAEWRRKLCDEAAMGEEIDEFGGGASGVGTRDEMDAFYASYHTDDYPDDGSAYTWREEEEAYAEYMRAGMATKKRKQFGINDDDGDPGKRRRESASQAQARATRERDEAAQRVLDEERRKDAEWRERTVRKSAAASKSAVDSAGYRRKWGVATAMADRGEPIAYADIPWPFDPESSRGEPDECAVREVLLGGMKVVAGDDARRALRAEMLRWHPDKFHARIGGHVAVSDKERVRAGVNVVASVVARLFKRSAGS